MNKTILSVALLAASTTSAFAADYTDGDTRKNDYKWMQGSIMHATNEMPNASSHDYLELEFGGRAGILDYYGYADVFNLTNNESSDKYDAEKIFIKFSPRISLDGLFQTDLSVGPVQELYLATLFNWSGANIVDQSLIGLGTDINVPWLGKVGLNFYGLYDLNTKDWNGYQVSGNWFKPFYFFDNGSFISYQGNFDYQFGANSSDLPGFTTSGGAMFNGIYWHSENFAVGYGLKGFKDVYTFEDGGFIGESTGFGHYFAATYKF